MMTTTTTKFPRNHGSTRRWSHRLVLYTLCVVYVLCCFLAIVSSAKLSFLRDRSHPRRRLGRSSLRRATNIVGSNKTRVSSLLEELPMWATDYIEWHKQSLQVLSLNHSAFSDYQYLVLRCIELDTKCGGASDRLHSIPTVLWAAAHSRRLLFIHWTKPAPLTEYLQPVMLDWRLPQWILGRIQFQRCPTIVSTKQLYRLHSNRTTVDMRFQTSDHGEAYFNQHATTSDDNNNNSTASFETIYPFLWNTLFQPSPAVQERIDQERPTTPYVGLHIRSQYFKDQSNHVSRVVQALQCASTLDRPIFVSSDSHTVLQHALRQSHPTVWVRTHTRPILHLDRGPSFLQHRPLDNHTASDFYDTFVDLYLLSYGQCVLYTMGGFGKWASRMVLERGCRSFHVVQKQDCPAVATAA